MKEFMAEKRKKQPDRSAKDKNAFVTDSSAKKSSTAKKAKRKRAGAHRIRNAGAASGHDVQKLEQKGIFGHKSNAGSKTQGVFPEKQNTFIEEGREETKPFDFQRKDDVFPESGADTKSAEPEFQGSEKLDRLQKKAQKAAWKSKAARKKIPKTKEYSLERVFDEKTGRADYVLTAVEKETLFKESGPVKRIADRAGAGLKNYVHGRIAEVEKENSAVEGAHKTEQKAEEVYRFVKRRYKSRRQRLRGKVAKLEEKRFQKEAGFHYQKFLEENPEIQEKILKKQRKKRLQKQRIKREYAKARRAGNTAENTKEAAVKSADFTTTVARKLQEAAAKHASLFATAGVFVLLLIMAMTSISSCGTMFSEVMSTALAGSYMSDPKEIDAVDLAFSKLEMELQKKIHSIETDYPDYDEYRYSLDETGHDPFTLISCLSAVYTEFTAADMQGEIESLFYEMYQLALNPTTETRTRTVTKTGIRIVTDPVTGEETEEEYEYEEEEEYTVTILEITLEVTDLDIVAAGRMDNEQKEIYALYKETRGMLQRFYTPLHLDWYNDVSSYYGYRFDPVTGTEQLHRGVDIAAPEGTAVFAAMDGTVTAAAYNSSYGNYIVIEDNGGFCTKYAHMDTLSVKTGQAVKYGDAIGTTGNTGSSTGSHLHIECLYHGEYYNPLFYFEAGEGTL